MRGIFRRGDVLAGAVILSVLVCFFSLTQVSRSADGSTWSLISATRLEKVQDIPLETYSSTKQIPCSDQEFSWKGRTGGWFSSIVTTTYTRCAVAMQDAYFETGATSQGRIRSYSSSEKTFGVEFPMLTNIHTFAVPNSHSIVVNSWAYQNYYGATPGLHIIKDYRLTLSESGVDSATNKIFKPTKPFDFELRAPDGALVPVRTGGLKFSPDGEWMVFKHYYAGKATWARLNLETYEVISFATPVQDYYAVHNAISNDGRYVAMYEPMSNLRIYDLERCEASTNRLVSRQCAFIDVYDQVKTKLGVSEIQFRNLEFKGSRSISLYIGSKKATEPTWRYGEYTLRYGEEITTNGYLAMGDSFSSGEGAYDYRPETDFYKTDRNYNLCHQSRSSYPYVLNKTVGFEWFGSVACSGAEREHIMDSPQARIDAVNNDAIYSNFLPGYLGQMSFLDIKSSPSPQVVTLTITGNDIGFGDILSACVHPLDHAYACYTDRSKREKLANLIESQIKPLTELLGGIKERNGRDDLRLYMIGYPKIFKPSGKCGWNADMTDHELEFADALADYLNSAIETAAKNAGARYVEVADALMDVAGGRDYRLCGDQQSLAVNGLVLRGTTSKKPEKPYYQESFHPNFLGHALLAHMINSRTDGLSQAMPAQATPIYTVDSSFRIALVGDDQRLVEKSNDSYDFSTAPGFVVRGDTLNFSDEKPRTDVSPGSKVTFELHSTPVKLGEGAVDADGNITGSVTIPMGVTPGYHEIHALYSNFFGEHVDRYRIVFVAASHDDYDDDGVPNASDPCSIGAQSGVDEDEDGIDDACDDEYAAQGSSDRGENSERQDVVQPQSTGAARGGDSQDSVVDNEEVGAEGYVLDEEFDMQTFGTDGNVGGYTRRKHFNLNESMIVIGVLTIVSTVILLGSKLMAKRFR